MPDISKIKLPGSNQVYDLKDAVAREAIAGGVSFILAWDGASTPVVADMPYGVTVVYNNVEYTGTLSAETTGEGVHAQAGAFYLIKTSTTTTGEPRDIYDEYVPVGVTGSKTWEKLGDTQIDLADVVTGVSLSKDTDTVIGSDATFSVTNPTITVTPSTTYLGATATGTTVGADGTASAVTGYSDPSTDTFVKSVSAETNKKMVTTTVPNVTSAGSASTWSFAMGTGTGATETLIISGSNSTAPTLGTAKTVATGATAVDGTGDAVVTGVTIGSSASAITALGTPSTSTVLTGVKVTAQPTVALAKEGSSATGRVQVADGITSASASGTGVAFDSKDQVTVLTNSTDVNVTKGQ